MTEKTINNLPDLFRFHICTLKKAAWDSSNTFYMCESNLKVVDFDRIPNEYCRGKGWAAVPNSNDALYIDGEKWSFIEFKNGEVIKADIYRKLYDSLIMLIDLKLIPDLDFARKHICYILVYNSEKYAKIPNSEGREVSYNYFQNLAQTEEKLFGIEKFENYLFNETHTYTKTLFAEKFVTSMEERENMNVS